MRKAADKVVCDQCGKETPWMERIDSPDPMPNDNLIGWRCLNIEDAGSLMHSRKSLDFCSANCVKDYVEEKI